MQITETGRRIFTEEHKRKIALALKGRPSPTLGRPMSDEQKQKLREAYLRNRQRARAEGKSVMSVGGYGLVSTKDDYEPSSIDECLCGRYYLLKLGCLWCNIYHGRRDSRTD